MDLKKEKIYVAGHAGMVGSSLMRRLEKEGYLNLICQTSSELDLTNQQQTNEFFFREKPQIVILAAAKVGGIQANNIFRADFIYRNLMIEANVINSAYACGVKKLLFLGSSCIYPKFADQPIKEEVLLNGPLEPTNEPYAVAKITGIKLCESYYRQYGANFFSLMPTNLYGINDNFDLETSHVVPALIRKFHEAKLSGAPQVTVWGSGEPRREFLFVDDLAEAVLFLLEKIEAANVYESGVSHLNVGAGKDIAIAELALLISRIVGFEKKIVYDRSKPDGTPRKLLDVSRMKRLGWQGKTSLEEGLKATYDWYLSKQ
jgi:GDP-L-fucose synthase